MLRDSGIQSRFEQMFNDDRRPVFLFGDRAYTQLHGVFGPFRGGRQLCGTPKYEFNRHFARLRISVEQAFGLTQNLWTANAFSVSLKQRLQP
ncbi:MAG: hypothetical protein M1837_006994, partial [Sclerophora amabilis]